MKVKEKSLHIKIFISLCTFIAFNLVSGISNIGYGVQEIISIKRITEKNVLCTYPILALFFWGGIAFFYFKTEFHKNIAVFFSAFCLALFQVVGVIYDYRWERNYSFLLLLINFIMFLGFFFFFYATIGWIYDFIDNYQEVEKKIICLDKKVFILILICWFPYLLIYLPGRIGGDSAWAINCFLQESISDRHPVLYTYLVGCVMKIGMTLVDGNLGILLNVIIQYVLSAFSVFYCLSFVFQNVSNQIIKKISVVFLLCNPIIAMYAITLHTDTIYAALFLITIIFFTKIVFGIIGLNRLNILKLILLTVLTCFFRKEGIIIFIILYVSALFVLKFSKKNIGCVLLFTIMLYLGCNTVLNMGVVSSGDSEIYKYSVFFQQTARYVTEYEEELSAKEIEIINNVLEYEKIKESYNPILSDRVMTLYKAEATEDDLRDYFKLLCTLFIKHPQVFVNSLLNNCYGYFYLAQNYDDTIVSGITKDVVSDPEQQYYYEWYGWKQIESFAPVGKVLYNAINSLQYIPIVGILFLPSFYVWIVIIMFFYFICNRNIRKCIVLLPYLIMIAVCVVSPANGHLRYIYSIILSVPFLLIMCLGRFETQQEVAENKSFIETEKE